MLSKRTSIITLIILTFIGSLLTAFSTNLLMGDLVNKGVSFMDSTLLSSFPITFISIIVIIGFFFVVRLFKRPKTFKKLSKNYLILIITFSALTFITSILGGILNYGTLVSSYPFKGYHIIMMILSLLILGAAIFGLLYINKKVNDDEEQFKVNAKHVFATIGWFLFICLAFNRLGSLFVSVTFIYWRNFYLTFPFYIYLLVPLALGVIKILSIFEVFDKRIAFISSIVVGGIALALSLYSIIVGTQNTAFISSLSQLMPLERISSMPFEIIIHTVSYLAVSLILILQNRKYKEA